MEGDPYDRTEFSPPPFTNRLASLPVVELADLLLCPLALRNASAAILHPNRTATCLRYELGNTAIEVSEIDPARADAVIARLAIIAGLDLGARGDQLGRVWIDAGPPLRPVELLLLIRTTPDGLAAELREIRRLEPREQGAQPPADLERGYRFGNYSITGRISRGSQGSVYRADHIALRKAVAIKVLHSELAASPELQAHFLIEARAACRARHPGIVDVTDYGQLPDGRPYYVMELMEFGTLSALIDRDGVLEPRRALTIVRQVVDALRSAAEQGVVHRDVKPSNIFVDLDDKVRIGDFGLALIREPEQSEERSSGGIAGTAHYMAPELIDGHHADVRSDLYSVGCVLFELLTGRVPYDGATPWEILTKHAGAPEPALAPPRGTVPAYVETIVRRAMARRPQERYQRPDEMLADIDSAVKRLDRSGWRRWLQA